MFQVNPSALGSHLVARPGAASVESPNCSHNVSLYSSAMRDSWAHRSLVGSRFAASSSQPATSVPPDLGPAAAVGAAAGAAGAVVPAGLADAAVSPVATALVGPTAGGGGVQAPSSAPVPPAPTRPNMRPGLHRLARGHAGARVSARSRK